MHYELGHRSVLNGTLEINGDVEDSNNKTFSVCILQKSVGYHS